MTRRALFSLFASLPFLDKIKRVVKPSYSQFNPLKTYYNKAALDRLSKSFRFRDAVEKGLPHVTGTTIQWFRYKVPENPIT